VNSDFQRKKARCGFTLIELLVVIAIIAILAALLVAGRCLGPNQRSTPEWCRSNLRQWGLALNMYLGDYRAYPGPPVMRLLTDYVGEKYPVPRSLIMTARWNGASTSSGRSIAFTTAPVYDRLPGWYNGMPVGFVAYGITSTG